jgi:transposase-like protein
MIEMAAMKPTRLRKAIRNNYVSFPSQIPLFVRNGPGNLQRYAVQLYFVQGWNCAKIARRYGYSRFYIWQIVNEWKRHAASLGYLQIIPPAQVLLDLRDAVQRTLDGAAPLGQGNFKPIDASSLISGQVAGPELACPVEGRIRDR